MINTVEALRERLAALTDDRGHCEGCEFDCGCQQCSAAVDALLAVLEIHDCVEHGMGFGTDLATYGPMRAVCAACGVPDEYAVAWPCATVKAVAGALGFELE
jgi:hypothetical protein